MSTINNLKKRDFFLGFELFYIYSNINLKFLKKNIFTYFNFNLVTSINSFFYILCISLNSITNLNFILLELYSYKNLQNTYIVYNLLSLLKDNLLILNTVVFKKNFSLLSSSLIFKNAVWLEREVIEFSDLYFQSLLDTRRLLLDYTINKNFFYNNTIINYNELYNGIIY